MNTINSEEYTKLNRAIYDLEEILECMGVRELSLSRNKRDMYIDTNAENIDTDLLDNFCQKIEQMHHSKFGSGRIRPAA